MAKTLAAHIYQNRTIFEINRTDLDATQEKPLVKTYKYDSAGYATFEFNCYKREDGDYVWGMGIYCSLHKKTLLSSSSISPSNWWGNNSTITISTKIYDDNTLRACALGVSFGESTKEQIDACFKDIYIGEDEDKKPVCPECGGGVGGDGDCENENCGEGSDDDIPTNPNDEPPVVWGYASEEIWDIEGRAGYNTPVFFRAFDDYGIYRFSYVEMDEHETEGVQIIRDFKPEKVSDIAYRFNIFKELEGNYKYKIIVYDTAKQKAESNIFNVTISPAITKPVDPPIPPKVADSNHIVLYDKKADNFENNGIGILDNDVIDCLIDKEENGVYELTLKYLITGKFAENLLDTENIIKCKADTSDNIAQLFRIYDSEYVMQQNIIIVKAQHISYDLKNAFVENVNMVNVTCKQATQALISRAIGNDKFVVDSDVDSRANFSQQRINVLEGIVGVEKSIFDTFAGHNLVIDRNNFYYNINKRIENDKGIIIAYGKNLLGFKRTINSDDVITGIYPYAHLRNGACLRLKEKVIYSKYKDNYAMPKIKAIDFTKETVVNEDTLRSEAEKYFENACDIPRLNYEVDFVSLYSNNPLLKDKFRSLEEVVLGDTVTIQDSKIGINVKARVIRTTYNRLIKRYEKVELGNFKNEHRRTKKNEYDNFKRAIRDIID